LDVFQDRLLKYVISTQAGLEGDLRTAGLAHLWWADPNLQRTAVIRQHPQHPETELLGSDALAQAADPHLLGLSLATHKKTMAERLPTSKSDYEAAKTYRKCASTVSIENLHNYVVFKSM
jgi:hypothetical protein